MRERGNVAIDVTDDAVEEALIDHHLAEVAEMIEQVNGDTPSSENASGDRVGGCLRSR